MADCFLCKHFDCDWIEDCDPEEEREVCYCDKGRYHAEEMSTDALESMECDEWEG